ncbi:hypothetical protein DVH24_013963 [Malus domestica]|uniref:Uncharacterized protein n=1 Tax=Malus domestica TaxID=3750 RepID=A0A498JF04_MALDO|nr:hypothetical protein DVH24_013963 [Malus domestica]
MEIDIDELLSRNRLASISIKRAIYVWVYSKSEQTGQNGKKQQLKIPKQLSGAFWIWSYKVWLVVVSSSRGEESSGVVAWGRCKHKPNIPKRTFLL